MLVLAAISSSASRCSLRKKYQNYKNMFIFAVTPSLSGVGGCGERGGGGLFRIPLHFLLQNCSKIHGLFTI